MLIGREFLPWGYLLANLLSCAFPQAPEAKVGAVVGPVPSTHGSAPPSNDAQTDSAASITPLPVPFEPDWTLERRETDTLDRVTTI